MAIRYLVPLLGVFLAGCGATSREWSGAWQPVHPAATAPRVLPLQGQREFYVAPLDGSLRGVLSRWARDAQLELDWHIHEDYTLFGLIATVRAADLDEALAQLSALYAGQRVDLSRVEGRIVARVRAAGHQQEAIP